MAFEFNAPPVNQPGIPDVQMPEFKSQAGMFGGGKFGLKQALAFGLAGLVSRRNPALLQGLLAQVMQRQQQAMEEQRYQRERQDKRSDFTFEQDYKLAHPAPPNNDTVADFNFIQQQLGPEAANTFLRTKTNPMVMTPYGPMPYSSVSGGSTPTAPVGTLTPLPEEPMPQASGGFPRSY